MPITQTVTATTTPSEPVVEAICVERDAAGHPVQGVPTIDAATGTGYCATPAGPVLVPAPPIAPDAGPPVADLYCLANAELPECAPSPVTRGPGRG